MYTCKKLICLVILVIAAVIVSSSDADLAAVEIKPPVELSCEYIKNPLGIDAIKPRLGWKLVSDERNQVQTAYRILVASNEEKLSEGKADMWDSGKIVSGESVNIEYSGKKVVSKGKYFWKVSVWDANDEQTPYSEPGTFEMGLLNKSDWKGKWIGFKPDKEIKKLGVEIQDWPKNSSWIWTPTQKVNIFYYFRRIFNIDSTKQIKKATITSCADNIHYYWINDVKAGGSTQYTSCAREVDITALLRPDKNAIAIKAKNINGPAGLLFNIHVVYSDGTEADIGSDKSARVSTEHPEGWTEVGFNDSSWQNAVIIAAYGKPMQWGKVRRDDYPECPGLLFRKKIRINNEIKKSRVYITGLGYYELVINGKKVGDYVLNPGLTDYDEIVLYDTYDITEYLKTGDNVIGVVLGNGRYLPPRIHTPTNTKIYGYPKLIMQAEIELVDGSKIEAVSDKDWKLATGPITNNNDYDGEYYDARLEKTGWDMPGYDDFGWESVIMVKSPRGKMKAQVIDPIRVTNTVKPVMLTTIDKGRWIYDMGVNMVGWVRLKVSGPRGTKVVMRYAEILNDDGTVYMDNLRSVMATDEYILKGEGAEVYEPRFAYHGFRYVEISGLPGEPGLYTIEGREVHSSVEPVGSFSCSNKLINQIHTNINQTARNNLRSIPTDCPQRDERQGWLGDIAIEFKGEAYNFNVSRFYTKWLDDIKHGQNADGDISVVCPTFWPLFLNDCLWPSTYIILPGLFYDFYSDKRILEHHYPYMVKWIKNIKFYLASGILDAGRSAFSDWCRPMSGADSTQDYAMFFPATTREFLATAYFYHDLELAARFAKVLGKEGATAKFLKQAKKIKKAFNKRFFDERINKYDDKTQTAYVLPLAFGLVPEGKEEAVFDNLVEEIMVNCKGHIGTGLIGAQWIMSVLADRGRADVAYTMLTKTTYPSFGYMISKGATTIWEHWNSDKLGPEMNSRNHLMLVGDSDVFFFEYLAGIKSVTPGFKTISIKPHIVGDLKHANASVNTVMGVVSSSWKREGASLKLDVVIPVNTTANISVPHLGIEGVVIKEGEKVVWKDGSYLSGVEGISEAKDDGKWITLAAGSGSYSFTVSAAEGDEAH